jgi:hypothetical protein
VGLGFQVLGSGFWVHRLFSVAVALCALLYALCLEGSGFSAASLIHEETEASYEERSQITSTKFQINLKFQYPITETLSKIPGGKTDLRYYRITVLGTLIQIEIGIGPNYSQFFVVSPSVPIVIVVIAPGVAFALVFDGILCILMISPFPRG